MIKVDQHPTIEECSNLWKKYETPLHIRKHCRAVALVSHAIGSELNKHGAELDLQLIMSAGLCHDLVRLTPRHDIEGAKIMKDLGYDQESEIIRVHMIYGEFSPISLANETDMVCLGDRTVVEHTYVGFRERYQYIIDKAIRNGHPEVEPFIKEKMLDVKRFVSEIEAVTGKPLEEITKDIKVE